MPALPPYIPSKDGQFNAWAANFSTLITAAPATYGLTTTDASNIAAQVLVWTNAYNLVTSPTTKTAATVAAKNSAKVSTVHYLRVYAQQIAKNPGVTAANKTAVGVNPQTSVPSPITPPTSTPVLVLQSQTPLNAVLRYRDSASSPSVKAKPYGVIACEIDYSESVTPITDPTLLTNTETVTKSPSQLAFDPSLKGKTIYLAARWKTRKGLYSPYSPIISLVVS